MLPIFAVVTSFVVLIGFAPNSFGATLPSRLPFLQVTKDQVDPGLDKWMRTHAETIPVSLMSPDQLLVWIVDKDPVSRSLILLDARRLLPLKGKAKRAAGVDARSVVTLHKAYNQALLDVPTIIKSELEKPAGERSLLLGDLVLEWQEASGKSREEIESLSEDVFKSQPVASCAAKKWSISTISSERVKGMSKDDLMAAIRLSKSYQSASHRRRYLESLISSLPEGRRSEFLPQLREVTFDLPILLRRFSWLQDESAMKNTHSLMFSEIERQARQKKCKESERLFVNGMAGTPPVTTISLAVDAATEIERCYRAEGGRGAAVSFWDRSGANLEKGYGKQGSLWASVRQGYLKWIMGELDEAAKMLDEVARTAATSDEFKSILAKAMYMQGKIAEDQGDLQLSSKHLASYIETYPDEEDFELAFNSLVVNFAARKDWKGMIPPLEKLMSQQSKMPMDKRPVGLTAFTWFWLGRAHLEMGRVELAKDIWRRLAGEYYSTFYGAMGHYLLEKTSGQTFALEPSRVNGFNFVEMVQPLSESNRDASTRSVTFLKAGFPDRSRCEVDEMTSASQSDYDTALVKALLLHASGAWLDAIKIYDVLPRSVRNALPVGFERILFPIKYVDLVKKNASKLEMDPDFVFALMRQESVFAPDAASPVGALGLMQLMPTTAKLEATKLSPDYIDREAKALIARSLEDQSSLRNPEINVTLGVHHLWRLMQIYKSPVFALTAYNASPAATLRWQKTIATDDWLTFIERIPYKETRAYVKLILRNYFYYKRWYNIADGKEQVHIETVIEDLLKLAKVNPTIKQGGSGH